MRLRPLGGASCEGPLLAALGFPGRCPHKPDHVFSTHLSETLFRHTFPEDPLELIHCTKDEARFARKTLVYKIKGALDGLEAENFLNSLLAAYDPGEAAALVLCCEDMPYLTSSGLRSIMTIGKTLRRDKAPLVVCGLKDLALEIYTSSGFATLFPSVATLDEAREIVEGAQ